MKRKIYALVALSLLIGGVSAQTRKARKVKPKVQTEDVAKAEREKALFEEMLPNTQSLFIIDSVVVDKGKVVGAIPLPPDYGSIVPYNNFFNTGSQPESYVYVNGWGNKCFYSEKDASGNSHLYTRDKLEGKWGKAIPISGIGDKLKDVAYPYMSADGTTLYFAAKSDEGLGGYDIYMTTYDMDNGRFLKADNIGLPFNSHSDDYFYVVDDNSGLAWFASTRRQPEGKVCVYTISTSQTRHNYNIDELGEEKVKRLALITRISDTWTTPEMRNKALEKVKQLKQHSTLHTQQSPSFSFVVTDNIVYTSPDDFATGNYAKYESIEDTRLLLERALAEIDNARIDYHNSSEAERRSKREAILKAEHKIDELRNRLVTETKSLRRAEVVRHSK